MPDRTPSDSQSAIRNFPIQRKHHIVVSGQARRSFLSSQLTPKSSPKKAKFTISCFNVKNGVSSGHVTNPLPPIKAKKALSTQISIIQKIISTKHILEASNNSDYFDFLCVLWERERERVLSLQLFWREKQLFITVLWEYM